MKCWKEECDKKLEFICPCMDSPIYSCDLHIGEHLKIGSKLEHHPEVLKIFPNPETKRDLIRILSKSLSNLYDFKRSAILDFTNQIKQLNDKMQNTLKSFEKVIKQHRQLISKINSTNAISSDSKAKLDEILLMQPEDSLENLEGFIDIFDKSNFFIDDWGIIGKKESINDESNQIVLFKDESMRIAKTDLSNFSSTFFDISIAEPKSRYITMCLIPENSIFCYGNYAKPVSSAFIIEKSNDIKQVIDAPYSLGLSGAIYCKNSVYIFGGYTGSGYVNNAFKYNFLENKWKTLKSMAISSSFVSCIARKSKVLLSGREHPKIYVYDTIENYYTEVHDTQVMFRKIICGNGKKYFVIETGGNIYESNHEWEIWNTIGCTEIENTDLMGYRVLWQDKVYFAYHTHDLYEFDLKLKTMRNVKRINGF